MRVIHSLKMDLVRPWTGDLLHMVQGDSNTRVVELQLFSDGKEWDIPSAELVTVAFKKPDQTKGFYETEGSVDGNRIQVVLAPQVLTAHGKVTVVVELRNAEGNSLASFPFGIMVAQNPEVDAEASEDYFNYVNPFITEALKEANLAAAEAYAAAEKANSSSEVAYRAERKVDTLREVVSKFHSNIVEEASGEVITLADASDLELAGLKLYGSTTQDGTPTPDAPVELVSAGDGGSVTATVCGKNLLDINIIEARRSTAVERLGEDTIRVYSTDSNTNCSTQTPLMLFREGVSYVVSCNVDSIVYGHVLVALRNANNMIISNSGHIDNTGKVSFVYTPTKDAEAYLSLFVTFITAEMGDATFSDIQIEVGAAATEYEPYKGTTATFSTPDGLPGIRVNSSGNHTDANGQQWLCNYVDFAKGKYIRTVAVLSGEALHAQIDGMTSSSSNNGATTTVWAIPTGWANIKGYWDSYSNLHSSHFGNDFVWGTLGDDKPNTVLLSSSANNENLRIYFRLPVEIAPDMDSAKAYLKSLEGLTFVHDIHPMNYCEEDLIAEELAAYAALHTNYPDTTVYNDAGAYMEMDYVADTKLYIDNKFNQLAAALVSNT